MSDPSSRRPPPRAGAGREGGPPRSSRSSSTARADADRQRIVGLVIIALAVLIGVVLVFRGLADPPEAMNSTSDASVVTTTTVDRDAPPPTDAAQTTLAPAPLPADVVVLVANGSGVSGLAGRTTDELTALGYQTLPPGNVDAGATTTSVFYVDGGEAAAAEVATALGLPATTVKPLPTPAPIPDIGTAVVLVVLGADFTSVTGE